MRLMLTAAAAALLAGSASADALYGKAEAFKTQARAMQEASAVAMIATQCGLRDDDWRVRVGQGVNRSVAALASRVWPNPHDAARQTALMEVSQDQEDRLELTLQTMTQNDCETLRNNPAALRRLDALAR